MKNNGFTLIELSIVLVIIGLIVGGVLVGQDLISTAKVRAQISQIEKYNTAVNTFRTKYNCLPGDCANAASAGLPALDGSPGKGDGNGVIEGYENSVGATGFEAETGETALFWMHLSTANLIEGSYTLAASGDPSCEALVNTGVVGGGHGCANANIASFMPAAKIGTNGVYVDVFSYNSINYFDVLALKEIGNGPGGDSPTGSSQYPGLTTIQAFNIDRKIDDGLPFTGSVITYTPANYAGGGLIRPGSGDPFGSSGADPATAITGDSTTCYDNNGGTAQTHYSTEISGGNIGNCALALRFQ